MPRKHNCVRCGQCCISVGSTFWASANISGYPELEQWQNDVELKGDNGMPCSMLCIEDGQASCYIEVCFGFEAKPRVCREQPEDNELCQYEKLFEDNDIPYPDKDIEEKRATLRVQNAEIYPHRKKIKLTCASCKRKISIMHAYKCFFCRLWFCWTCSKTHFKKSEIR